MLQKLVFAVAASGVTQCGWMDSLSAAAAIFSLGIKEIDDILNMYRPMPSRD